MGVHLLMCTTMICQDYHCSWLEVSIKHCHGHQPSSKHTRTALRPTHQSSTRWHGVCCTLEQEHARFRIRYCFLHRLRLDRPPNMPTRSSSIRLIGAAPPASPPSIITLLPVPLCNTDAMSALRHIRKMVY